LAQDIDDSPRHGNAGLSGANQVNTVEVVERIGAAIHHEASRLRIPEEVPACGLIGVCDGQNRVPEEGKELITSAAFMHGGRPTYCATVMCTVG